MTSTVAVILTRKDYFEITFWIVSLLILIVTALAVYFAPLKAVEIGRKLNDEQNQQKAKTELFLTLFSLRGNPTSYSYVNALNQIDIVFQNDRNVLTAWGKLFDSFLQNNLINSFETRNMLRTELLSEMAHSLGYQKLKQTDIQKNYSPQAHADNEYENWNRKQAEKDFFESGTKLYKMHISVLEQNYGIVDKNKEES